MNHLLFDLDGTLTDPQEGIVRCIQHALRSSNRPVPGHAELLWCIGPPLHVSFAEIDPSADEAAVWDLVKLYRERFATQGMFENKIYEGMPEMLDRLASMYKLHLATSKPHVFAKTILRHFKMEQFFSSIHGSELDGTRSDKADLIGFILREEKILARNALMIGDRKHDVEGAKKNGVRCVGVGWGYGSMEELVEAGADHLVTDLPALENYCNEVMSFLAR